MLTSTFSRINDRHGTAVGDEALRVFAATVGGKLREDDVVPASAARNSWRCCRAR